MNIGDAPKVSTETLFVLDPRCTWMETLRSAFACKRTHPKNFQGLKSDKTHFLSPAKAKTIATVGLTLFALALAVTMIIAAALLFPPMGAIVGALIPLFLLKHIAIGAGVMGLIGLVVGAAAVDKLRHGVKDTHKWQNSFADLTRVQDTQKKQKDTKLRLENLGDNDDEMDDIGDDIDDEDNDDTSFFDVIVKKYNNITKEL